LVNSNSTQICFMFTNKHNRLCTQMHLILIQYIIPKNSIFIFKLYSHIDFIIVIVSLLPKFGLLLKIRFCDHILIITIKKNKEI